MAIVFNDLLDSEGRNIIRHWLDHDVPTRARVKIDQVLKNLRVCDRLKPPIVVKIKGDSYAGVFEVRVLSDKVQYRPLGGYGPHQGEFTLVVGAIEKNDRITPPDAFETASRRIAEVNTSRRRVCEHEYEPPLS